MVDMVLHQLLPASLRYSSDLAEAVERKHKAGISAKTEQSLAKRLSECCDCLYDKTEQMAADLKHVPSGSEEAAAYYSDVIIPAMRAVRKDADKLEKLTAKSYWPYPTYSDILFY